MIRIIILLLPVLVSLSWAILLAGNKKEQSAPRLFLSKFMFMAFLITCFHFFYFGPFPKLYPYFDIPLVFLATLVYPVYHIYFRLLTIDKKFSLSGHWIYLILPVILTSVYTVGVFLTPFSDYRAWLLNETGFVPSSNIRFLESIHNGLVTVYLIQLVASLAGNEWLLYKYGDNAAQYYSNLRDTKRKYPRLLNYSAILLSTTSFAVAVIKDSELMSHSKLLYSSWLIFAVAFFIIGYLGIKQKSLNPAFEQAKTEGRPNLISESSKEASSFKDTDRLLRMIRDEFEQNKIYLNSELCIMDIVKATGSNRTYISSAINQRYKLNFCTFTNSYRIEELKKAIHENPKYSADQYAELCGFGSVNSMKRAVSYISGMQYSEFRRTGFLTAPRNIEHPVV